MALARYQTTAVDDAGNILPSATVTVTNEATSALAPLFSDRDGAVSIGNPFTALTDGSFSFHVAGGAYQIDVVLGGSSRTLRYVAIGTAQEYDSTTFLALGPGDVPQFAGIQLGHATDTTITRVSAGIIAVEGVTVSMATNTLTLSNKRITPRVNTITSSATPTTNTDNYDVVNITALAAAITSMTTNLTGTPVIGDRLLFMIKDNGTARSITWGASFAAKGQALPTTTVISKLLTAGFIWNGTNWGCVASVNEV